MAEQPVSLPIRVFVRTFLVIFVVCALARIEAWPFTGWRLFSHVRKPVQTSWSAVVVDAAGRETAMTFADAAYRGTIHILGGFASLTDAQRSEVCHAWTDELRRSGIEPAKIRIDLVTIDHSQRSAGHLDAPAQRIPRYECAGGVARSLP